MHVSLTRRSVHSQQGACPEGRVRREALACHRKVDSLEVSLEARLLNATSEVIECDFCK